MKKYRIDKYPASFYLNQFKSENIHIFPYRAAGHYVKEGDEFTKVESAGEGTFYLDEELSKGMLTIEYGEKGLAFEIYFPAENGIINSKNISLIKEVLADLPVLDAIAREIPAEDDYEEYLGYIIITDADIELRYLSSTINTDWGAYFKKMPDSSWYFEGLG